MLNISNVHQVIKERGIAYDGINSDLLVPVNEETVALLREYASRDNITVVPGRDGVGQWFRIPLANDDFFKGV